MLFRTRENHEHNGLEERSGLSDNAKKEIKKLLDLRQKPKQILATLREKAIPVKNKAQVENFIKKIQKGKYGRT